MRRALLVPLVVVLAGCPSTSGTEGPAGPQGAQGPQGATGAPGAKGDKGDKGDQGDVGQQGQQGAQGAQGQQGPAGPQGIQGPQGAVLVVDGGVVIGPPGASVIVTPVTPGGMPCPNGGIRVTQLSDAGISHVCNGADGMNGAPGAQGAQGPIGPQGVSVTASVLAMMSPQCPTGGLLITLPDGGATTLCNGAQGPQGTQGPTGASGMQGPQGLPGPGGPQGVQGVQGPPGATGATGPAGMQGMTGLTGPAGATGPPGAVLYVDGGVVVAADWVTFAGFTATLYTGNLGGRVGGHAACESEFPGSHFCDENEYSRTTSDATVGLNGAWIDDYDVSQPAARGLSTICSRWSQGTTSYEGILIRPDGTVGTSYVSTSNYGCGLARPVACCFAKATSRFRGFTPMTYTGNLGGRLGAHAICRAAFPGSHFCHEGEYGRATSSTPVPASGVWIDDYDAAQPGDRGLSTICSRWSQGTTSYEGILIRTDGTIGTSYVSTSNYGCGTQRPLACCD